MLNTGERQIWNKETMNDYTYFRHIFILNYLKKYMINKKVIEFGSGMGYNVNYFSDVVEYICGLEINKRAVEFSKKKYVSTYKKDYFIADLTTPIEVKYKFDVVYSIFVLEHISKEKNDVFFNNIHSVLKEDGLVIILIPNGEKEGANKFPYHVQYIGYDNFNKTLKKYFDIVKIYGIEHSNKVIDTIAKYNKTPQGKLNNWLRYKNMSWLLDFIPNSIKRPFRPKFKEKLTLSDFRVGLGHKDSSMFMAVCQKWKLN